MATTKLTAGLTAGLTVERRGQVIVLLLSGGVAHPLDPELRKALIAALQSVACEGSACERIVLAGAGVTFSSALALAPDLAAPTLAELCAAVESAAVPVVVALHGLAMGPGAELALAAHARIAAPGTRIVFPEVALGLCPEGGSSRRLLSLVGARPALNLLLSGRAVAASEAHALGLVDALADDPLTCALAADLPPRRDNCPAAEVLAGVAEARRANPRALPAVARIIDCVEAAVLLPPPAHRAFEVVAREDLEATPEAAALRSAVRAERRAAALPVAVARLRPAAARCIALHGAGAPLVTLARMALARGLEVCWFHPSEADRLASLAALDLAEAAEVRAGRLAADVRQAARARLRVGGADAHGAALHVHDAPSGARRAVAGDDAAHLVLGGAAGELGLVLAPSQRASELAVLAEEAPEAIALAVATLRQIGLPPVLVGPHPVLGQRVMAAGGTALAELARTGVPLRALAAALGGFGAQLPQGLPESGATLREMTATEIVNRWLGAMANAALRLLDQGVARRPADVDHLLVAGHHFPRWRGGPMHWADRRGLLVLRHDLRGWAGEHPVWSPAPLIDRLIEDGLRLPVLDG